MEIIHIVVEIVGWWTIGILVPGALIAYLINRGEDSYTDWEKHGG